MDKNKKFYIAITKTLLNIMCDIYEETFHVRILNEIVPEFLRQKHLEGKSKFFVKGGRAVDAYLEIPTGSPDWDICVSSLKEQRIFFEELKRFILPKSRGIAEENFKEDKLILNNNKVLRLNVDISKKCKDKEIIDIVAIETEKNFKEESQDVEIVRGIPYKSLRLLYKDLAEVLEDRKNNLDDKKKEYLEMKDKYLERYEKSAGSWKTNEDKMIKALDDILSSSSASETLKGEALKIKNKVLVLVQRNDALIRKYLEEADQYQKMKNEISELVEESDEYERFNRLFEKWYDKYISDTDVVLNKLMEGEKLFGENEKEIIKDEVKYEKTYERFLLIRDLILQSEK